MRATLLILYTLLALIPMTMAAQKPLKVGDKAPDFTLKDQDGNDFTLSDAIGDEILVVYFYPKDETPGCTKQACAFRDQHTVFSDEGARVIGISADDVTSHKKFAEKYNLPFTLLADEGDKVRKLWGVPGSLFGLISGRVTYIIDKKGVVRHIYHSQTNAISHIDESLKVLKEIKAEK